ncbi:hypothetical protein LR013_02395 [candidate division NPL-UPA2 bacterium]|nr:hypothetical protein [candidate division NPL-UPA2 bacterium]
MGYGMIDPELLKVVAAIITSIVGPIIGLLIFLIKRSMEKGQSEIKNTLAMINTNITQLSQSQRQSVIIQYHPEERIKKVEEIEERIKGLEEKVKKVEVVEEE